MLCLHGSPRFKWKAFLSLFTNGVLPRPCGWFPVTQCEINPRVKSYPPLISLWCFNSFLLSVPPLRQSSPRCLSEGHRSIRASLSPSYIKGDDMKAEEGQRSCLNGVTVRSQAVIVANTSVEIRHNRLQSRSVSGFTIKWYVILPGGFMDLYTHHVVNITQCIKVITCWDPQTPATPQWMATFTSRAFSRHF